MKPRTDRLPLVGKLGLLAALYVAQGLPFGFFTQTVAAIMRKQGYRLADISNAALLTLPWALKFLWAPLVDRHPTPTPTVRARRVRWILACQAAQIVAFALLAAHGSLAQLQPLFIGFFVLNLISATQDIATDGFAVDTLRGKERGYANGVQVAGYRGGMVIGGGLLLIVIERIGARAGFLSLAGLTLLLSLPLFLVEEAPPMEAPSVREEAPRLPHFLRLPGVWRALLVVGSYKLAEALASGVLRPFLIDRGLSLAALGAINGVAGSTGGLLGALSGGALASLIGRRRALAVAGVIQTAAVFLFAYASAHPSTERELALICFVEAFSSSLATAALFTAMMDWSRPIVGATDYTVQASAVVIATGLATLLSGRMADALGYTRHFVVAGVVGGVTTLMAIALYPPPRS